MSSTVHRVTGPDKKDIIGRAMATNAFREFRRFFAEEGGFQFLRTIVTESDDREGKVQTVTFILEDGINETEAEINITFHNGELSDAIAEVDHYINNSLDFIEFYRYEEGDIICEEFNV